MFSLHSVVDATHVIMVQSHAVILRLEALPQLNLLLAHRRAQFFQFLDQTIGVLSIVTPRADEVHGQTTLVLGVYHAQVKQLEEILSSHHGVASLLFASEWQLKFLGVQVWVLKQCFHL